MIHGKEHAEFDRENIEAIIAAVGRYKNIRNTKIEEGGDDDNGVIQFFAKMYKSGSKVISIRRKSIHQNAPHMEYWLIPAISSKAKASPDTYKMLELVRLYGNMCKYRI